MGKIKAIFELKRPEYEFLPSILAIQEKPPSPIGRMILWILSIFITIMIVWATIGKVNIVASAQGKIIPNGNVRIVQPAITGTVDQIHIKDGDFVKKNELLISLNKTIIESKLKQVINQLNDNKAKNRWLMHFFKNTNNLLEIKKPTYSKKVSENKNLTLRHNLLFAQEVEELRSKLKIKFDEITKFKNQKIEAQLSKEKTSMILPIIKKREKAIRDLREKGMASETEYLDVKQALIESEYNLKLQENQIESLALQIKILKTEMKDIYSNKRLDLQNRIIETFNIIENTELEIIQHKQSLSLHEIRSPINGFVQDLAIHTRGGSLNATEPVLKIVPENDELIVEAMILNKDIGFLSVGQETTVKVDTFNFVKHGSLKGEITNISNDAIQDEKLGLVFKAKVKLEDTKLYINGKFININSGMSVVVEAKTGTRRIINFFFNPVRKVISESIQER